MDPRTLERFAGRPLPRYTSYPTAPNFHDGVDAGSYAEWLGRLRDGDLVSLYLHVPYCRQLCWYCGCHTRAARREDIYRDYADLLVREVELAAAASGGRLRAGHLHWGGGTPSLLPPAAFQRVMGAVDRAFVPLPDSERAIELDPRNLDDATLEMLQAAGINRASIGLQDVNPAVQVAINRVQPFETTADAVARLRAAGISGINLDLIYGLPHQGERELLTSVERAVSLQPDRLALFGYAHVPWMKRHQRLIDSEALAGPMARAQHFEAAADLLEAEGYVRIGLDHFALPSDSLARAARCKRLRRNFQGYTTDGAERLLGFGESAISALPQGYLQNVSDGRAYAAAIRGGRFATVRGISLGIGDKLRRAAIEALMCDLALDLDALRQDFGLLGADFSAELAALAPMADEGLVTLSGQRIAVTRNGRPFLRAVAAVFDSYLGKGPGRHSQAV
jgi:oxygen-independent coproporphyrinogen-3 oxidase